jgi:CRP/FNR family transcriptional regulator, cyclic AMP receptor protein
MNMLEEQLQKAGLKVVDHCERLTSYSPDLLDHSPLLEDFTHDEADVLAASMLLVHAEPGQVLIREGDAGDWMMLILKGTVDVTKHIELRADDALDSSSGAVGAADAGKVESTESRVAVLQRGAAIGEMSMLDGGLRYTTCTAIEAVEAGVLGSHAIGLLIRDHPGVGAKLMVKITQLMAQRLRNVGNQLVKLLQKA